MSFNRFKPWIVPAIALILGGVVVNDRVIAPYRKGIIPRPNAVQTADGVKLGRFYGPIVVATLGDAWSAAAKSLEEGKSVAEARDVLQTTWKEARTKAFLGRVAPEFAKVLPEGTEPDDPSKRAETVKLWRDFARGLKGGR